MKTVLVTPLYPPDNAPPALYAKELARRLSASEPVSVIAYAYIPEELPGVFVTVVPKQLPLLARLVRLTTFLFSTKPNDRILVINGPSVELPLFIVSLFIPLSYTLLIVDIPAYERTQKRSFERFVHRNVRGRAHRVIESFPEPRPEILPLEPKPARELQHWENAWREHLSNL